MRNSNSQPFGTIIFVWQLVVATIYCHPNVDENFVADIVPIDVFVAAPSKSKQVKNELKQKGDSEMLLDVTEITEKISTKKPSNVTIFGNGSSEIKNNDIAAFYDSRRISHHADYAPTIVLIAISGIAIMVAFSIAMISALCRYRRKNNMSSKIYRHPKSSFFAPETEPRTWDSLSFSCSVAEFSTSKMQFHSLESLSDDSYINSLDEAISHKASIVHKKSQKDGSPKSMNNTVISELSVIGH